jgi:hypothetical protein
MKSLLATTFVLLLSIGFMVPQLARADDFCCTCITAPGCTGGAPQVIDQPNLTAAGAACQTACGGTPQCVGSHRAGTCEALQRIKAGPIIGFTNPICPSGGGCDIPTIIGNVIRAVLGIVGSLALLMFVYAGIRWMMAGGNQERIKKAKDIMVWTALGLVVIFASYAIVTFVLAAVGV